MDNKILAVVATAAYQIFFDKKYLPTSKSKYNDLPDLATVVLAFVSERDEIVRPPHFEPWIETLTEIVFFSHFRMTRTTFEALLAQVGPLYKERRKHHGGVEAVPINKCLLITLWILAKGDTYISTADRFSIAPASTHLMIVSRMIDILSFLKDKFIKWPSRSEASIVEAKFKSVCGFPGVIGAIDGSHIMCKVPEMQQDSYQNRKCQHSIIMQGICSPERLLTNIFVGFPGRSNDARVLQKSPLYQAISEKGPEHLFYENYHLIGDKAYPIQDWLLTPYRDTGHLSRAQKNYNIALSKSRVVIEHVFGMLKGRWRILIYVNAYSIERIVKIVGACSVLHNVCLLNNDNFDELYFEDPEPEEQDQHGLTFQGNEKRDLICQYLSP